MNDEKQLNGFTIENDVLIKYVGEDENIVVPSEIKKINDYAFYNCRNIKSVQIPDSVLEIGKRVFMGCSQLQTITIPNNAKILGEPSVLGHIFSECSALEKIETSNKETILSMITKYENNEFYILEAQEEITTNLKFTPQKINKIINHLKNIFDYIIIDTTNIINETTISIFSACDLILLLGLTNTTSINEISRFLHTLKD